MTLVGAGRGILRGGAWLPSEKEALARERVEGEALLHPRAIGVPSCRGALPMWARFLSEIAGPRVRGAFARPGGVEAVEVEPTTGRRALSSCREKRTEYFLAGTAPEETCPAGGEERGFFRRLFGG